MWAVGVATHARTEMGLFRRQNSLGQPLLDDEGELLPETPTKPYKEDGGADGNVLSPDGSTLQSPGMASLEVSENERCPPRAFIRSSQSPFPPLRPRSPLPCPQLGDAHVDDDPITSRCGALLPLDSATIVTSLFRR